jgi:hypothetical protein
MKKKIKILLAIVVLLLVFVADGFKSLFLARQYVASEFPTATNVRFERIRFTGIWGVDFTMDAWHKDALTFVRVAPLWPKVYGHTTCR